MERRSRIRPDRVCTALLCVLVLGAGCGSDDRSGEGGGSAAPAGAEASFPAPAADSSPAGPPAAALAPDGSAGSEPDGSPSRTGDRVAAGPAAVPAKDATSTDGAGKSAAAAPAGSAPGPSSSSGGPGGAAGKGSAPSPGAAGANPGPAPPPGGPAPGGPAARKGELVFGSFGIENGVLAAVSGPVAPALRAWVADVNARGGIAGHPVRVVMADSGGDPARSQSIARQMVEKDHVIAILNPYTIGELDPVMGYLESKGVPVVGQMGGDPGADYSVMSFNPVQSADKGLGWELVFDVVKQTDKRKAAIMYCREATICQTQRKRVVANLPYDGLTIVYEAQVSLAQPDYTAEALGAQRAGADVVMLFLDINSIARFSKSAGRQGYKPVLATAHQAAIDYALPYAKDLDGLLVGGRVPPYDGPAMADYRAAISRYQPGAVKGDMGAGAWVVGRFVEKVGAGLDNDPTSAELIEALYAVQGETLGGLLPGITFPRHKDRSNVNLCAIPAKFTGGKFVPHDPGATFVCAPQS